MAHPRYSQTLSPYQRTTHLPPHRRAYANPHLRSITNWRQTQRPEKYVCITYSCGSYERNGPQKFPLSRLWNYSAQARIDLSSQAKTTTIGGSIHWQIELQHWKQYDAFAIIWDWFMSLPSPCPADSFKGHLEIDLPDRLDWEGLVLLDVCVDWLKLLKPLDTRKTRSCIWVRLERKNQDWWPLGAEELHLAWMMFQPTDTGPGSEIGENNIKDKAQRKVADEARRRERRNAALITMLKSSVSEYLDRHGIDAYDKYIQALKDIAEKWGEDNTELVQAIEERHKSRNYRVVGHGKKDSGFAMDSEDGMGSHG